jgi:hypothetical protein
MDLTQEKTLDELVSELSDTVTISSSGYYSHTNGWLDPQYGAVPPLTVSNIDGNINGTSRNTISIGQGGYTIGPGSNSNTYSNVWTTGTTSPYTFNPSHGSGKIQLTGKDADIEVNGWSLVESIKKIEERLNILHPNEKLETEWEELKSLGEQYRKLEQHIKDKQATWDRLKAMPPPVAE